MLCPDDGHKLEEIQDWDYPYFKCSHCHGIWLDCDIKEKYFISKSDLNLPDLLTINPNKLLPNEDFTCPRDGGDLFVYNHGGVEIDICEKCGGVWLDYGEKEEIEKQFNKQDLTILIGVILFSLFVFLLFFVVPEPMRLNFFELFYYIYKGLT